MADVEHSLDVFKHLGRRAILPLVSPPGVNRAGLDVDLPKLSNVQGDVLYLFPKVNFQSIDFCRNLQIRLITTESRELHFLQGQGCIIFQDSLEVLQSDDLGRREK